MKKFKRETHISRVIFVACIGIHQLSTQWKRTTCPAHAQKICYILQLLLIWNRWLRFIEIDSIGNICDGREKKINQQELSTDNFSGKNSNPQNIFHTINKKMEACKTNGHHSKYKNRGTPRIESTTHTQKKLQQPEKSQNFIDSFIRVSGFPCRFFVLSVPGLFFTLCLYQNHGMRILQ